MADKRKYVSEFEVQSNIDVALSELKKYYVEFSKMPNVVENFNKSLKKNAQLEKNFFNMMSAVPKTMKRLSELSKIELIPRKELEKLTNTIQLISSVAKGLEGKSILNSDEVAKTVTEFENVVSELNDLEVRHGKVIEKAEAYNRLVIDASRLQKNLAGSSDKFKNSTVDIAKAYTSIKLQIGKVSKGLEKSKEEGKLSQATLKAYNEKLSEIRKKVGDLNKDYDTMTNSVESLSGDFDKILSSSRDISGVMKNSIARTSYENIINEVKELRDELEIVTDNTEKSSGLLKEQILDIKRRLDVNVEALNLAVSADERLVAETKTANDAFNLMTRMTSEIQEEMQDISNIELRRQFQAASDRIQKMREELERMILIEGASNEAVRAKMGLLKNEGDKLRIIVNRQLEIKKLEEESISATVRRAKEQDKVNQAYIRQVLSQRKNLGGLIDAMKVYKTNIPTKAIATFGEKGLVAAKVLSGAFKLLGVALGPVMGAFTLLGLVKMAFELEKQVKGARKQILAMAADTNTAGSAFDTVRKGGNLSTTAIEKMRKQTEQWTWTLGISMEQAVSFMGDFTKSGFTATKALSNLGDMMGIAMSLGIEVSELASRAGNLRAEFGMNLSEIGTGFIQLQKDAKNAGITTSIFFDKVVNAATGLGLYGKKIEDVSSLFSGLVKNMKLPEKAATDAAASVVGSFKDISSEMQITTYRLGKGNKYWQKSFREQVSQIDAQLKNEEDAGRRAALLSKKRALQEMDQMKGLNAELMRARGLDPTSEFLMRMQAVAGKVGINIEADIEKVDTSMTNSFYKMEKIGELFGISREATLTMKRLSSNLLENARGLKAAFGKQEGNNMIDVLSSVSDTDERTRQLTEKLIKMEEKGKDLKKIQGALKDRFPELGEDLGAAVDAQGNVTAEGLAKVVAKLDVNFKALSQTQKQNVKEELKRQAKVAGLQALRQTRSTEEALNNTIAKILRNIFTAIEKLVRMFGWVFGSKFKGIEKINDVLTENENAIGDLEARIGGKRGELEISALEFTKDISEGKNVEYAKAQIKAIEQEQKTLDKASKQLEAYSENQRKQRKELEVSGKVTDRYKAMAQEGSAMAGSLMKSVNPLGLGEKINLLTPAFARGGVVPGSNFQGDRILSALDSGELVLPKDTWQNLTPAAVAGGAGSMGSQSRNIYDYRTININVNQNDRRQIEQIVLNAIYTDKLK